jgi:putative chitinase
MFELKKEHLAAMIPGNKDVDAWHAALVDVLPKYGINTERRMAHSEKALKAVFGRYFGSAPKADAAEYARNPEMIANRVYNDTFRKYKMGNVQEGDGWKFRGRGLKQLTGRDNYTRFGASINISAEEAAIYVATPKGAVESACWFWDSNKLNNIADTDDVTKMTKKINGGNIGLADRQSRYKKAMEVFGNPVSITEDAGDDDFDVDDIGVLRKGCKGEGVKMMQEALGVGADGAFGPGTERALQAWQVANGLVADGIAGPMTLEKLLG